MCYVLDLLLQGFKPVKKTKLQRLATGISYKESNHGETARLRSSSCELRAKSEHFQNLRSSTHLKI